MRSELEQLEKVDQYLSGKMSSSEATSFQAEMNADPALKSLVKDQELLIQTVNRKALMAEINAVAGLGASGAAASSWGLTQWLITGAITIAVGAGSVFLYSALNEDQQTTEKQTNLSTIQETQIEEQSEPKDTGDYFAFTLNASPLSEEDFYEEEDKVNHQTVTNQQPNFPEKDERQKDGLLIPNIEFNDVNSTVNENPNKITQEKQQPVHTVDRNRKASFPGGLEEMKAFFQKELLYPRTPKDKGLSGTVRVKFIVTADGKITELRSDCFILKDVEGLKLSDWKFANNGKSRRIFENRAERIFRISQPWTPATNSEGNPTLSEQTWYVNFDLKGESSIYQLEDDNNVKIEKQF